MCTCQLLDFPITRPCIADRKRGLSSLATSNKSIYLVPSRASQLDRKTVLMVLYCNM